MSRLYARVNFDADERTLAVLKSLKDATGATKKGILVEALLMLKWCLSEHRKGHIIVALDPDDVPDKASHFVSSLIISAGVATDKSDSTHL